MVQLEEEPTVEVDLNFYEGLRKIPKKIFDIALDYIENKRNDGILCLNVFPNAGKTFILSLLTSMLNKDKLPFVYFTLNYQIARDFIKFKEENYNDLSCYLLRGKSYENKETGEKECIDDLGFSLAKKYGQNGFYCLEDVCPEWITCVHRLTINEILTSNPPLSWAGHFLHYPTLYKIYKDKWSWKDILIIMDEDMSSTFFVNELFSLHRINESIENTDDRTLLIFFDFLHNAIEEYNQLPYEPKTIRKECEARYEAVLLLTIKNTSMTDIKSAKTAYDEEIFSKFRTNNELKYPNPFNFMEEFKFFVDSYRGDPKGFLTIHTYTIDFNFHRMIRERNNMIILNATFEPELFKCLVPPGTNIIVESVPGEFELNQRIFAVKGKADKPKYATYPVSSLYSKKVITAKFKELAKITAIFARRHKKTVVFCVNKLKKELESILINEVKMGLIVIDTFAWAIGKNQYREDGSEFDGCVIFGTPYHNVDHFKKMITLYQANEETVFRNETPNKIEQAINRIGLLTWKDEKRDGEILILSSIDLPNLHFVEGHPGIERYRLRDLEKVLDETYTDPRQLNILKGIHENGPMNMTEIKKKITGSHSKIIITVNELVERGFLISEEISGRGRPTVMFFITKKGVDKIEGKLQKM